MLEDLNSQVDEQAAYHRVMSAEIRPLPEQLAALVFQVAERLGRCFATAAAELDLPPAQAQALMNLRSPAPMRELAETLACDASNVTGIVDGLERRGLVVRRPDPKDRRVKHLVLTEDGERQRAALYEHNAKAAADVFALPEPGQEALRDLLAEVLRRHQPTG
jgi:DNA-binding MarR family transcriptional regulator